MKPRTLLHHLIARTVATGLLALLALVATAPAWSAICQDCVDGNPDNGGGVITDMYVPGTTIPMPNPDVTWSAPGATILHPTLCRERAQDGACVRWDKDRSRAMVTWSVGGSQLWSTFSKTVSAQVRDADGLTASTTRIVHFKAVLDSSLPPICDMYPNHYECGP